MNFSILGIRLIADEFDDAPRRYQTAVVRSLNRGIDAAKTFAVRAISKDIGIKNADVSAAVKVKRATANAPEALFRTPLTRLPLTKFGAKGPTPTRGRGRGVSYRIGGRSRGRLEQGFLARMSNGHIGVFVRKGASPAGAATATRSTGRSRGAWSANLPIAEAHGPSLAGAFFKFRAAALARGAEVAATTLAHEVDRMGGK